MNLRSLPGRVPAYLPPVISLLVIGIVEGLYDLGMSITSPGIVLLLPVVFAAAVASWRVVLLTGFFPLLYNIRHSYLNRGEVVDPTIGISPTDVSRLLLFSAAIVGLVLIARYREQQREAEAALQEAYDRAIEASRAKSEFLAVVSHELRTPLTTIIQYTDLLLAGIPGRLNADQEAMIRHIEGGALHLRGLIQQLLDYARLEGREVNVVRGTVNVSELARSAAGLLRAEAEQKGLRLNVQVPPEPAIAETDAGKLRQIMLNLLDNALKFTDTGSIDLKLDFAGDSLRIEVSDTGMGIPAESQGRVFEPFWQEETALTRTRGGIGLGLAITRQLVTALGGSIEVQSEVGRGTSFMVRLPLGASAATEHAASAHPGSVDGSA